MYFDQSAPDPPPTLPKSTPTPSQVCVLFLKIIHKTKFDTCMCLCRCVCVCTHAHSWQIIGEWSIYLGNTPLKTRTLST